MNVGIAESGLSQGDLGVIPPDTATIVENANQTRSISEVARKYGATFIHGILPNFTPETNSLLIPSADWKTKLQIFLAFEPTISASSIRPGDQHFNMWGRMGVILAEGEIESANDAEAGTGAFGVNQRIVAKQFNAATLDQNIDYAINSEERSRT